ncbi:MAG: radical SAM protein [Bacteroidales bacterium]|nr:radical SAM protein [Bacteroidales bacterium]
MEPGEALYRKRFAEKYNRLFYDAWRNSRFNPVEGAWWLRTLSRQKRMKARRMKAETEQLMVPPLMIFSITNQCNLSCKGCYARKRMEEGGEELSLERIDQLFNEASELGIGVIMIAGGEPLIRPEILWAATAYRDIIFPVFTNGMLLNTGSISYFKKHRNLVPILSIEGNRHFTDQRRGNGMYARLIHTMEQLQQTRRLFGMSVTLTRDNFDEVTHPVWLQAHHRMGSSLFFLVEYVPQSENDLHLCLTEEQKEELQSRLETLRKQMPAQFVSLPGDESQYGGCLAAARGFVHVSAEGSLEPCPFAPYSDINIRNISLKEALKSKFLGRIRESHHLLTESQGGCALWENRDWVVSQLESTMARPV